MAFRSKSSSAVRIVILILLGLVAIGFVLYQTRILSVNIERPVVKVGQQQNQEPLAPTATPTIAPLPQGLGEYNVGQGGAATGPHVTKITLDPHDPKVGQQFKVRVTSSKRNAPVSKVVVKEVNDQSSTEHTLTLVSGDTNAGEYEGSWNITQTHNYIFSVVTTAYATDGTTTVVDMVFRP